MIKTGTYVNLPQVVIFKQDSEDLLVIFEIEGWVCFDVCWGENPEEVDELGVFAVEEDELDEVLKVLNCDLVFELHVGVEKFGEKFKLADIELFVELAFEGMVQVFEQISWKLLPNINKMTKNK